MATARKKKVSIQSEKAVKTLNFYGKPNRGKFDILHNTQIEYNNALNYYIQLILKYKDNIFEDILNNNYKYGKIADIEKDNRFANLNSKLSQNAYFEAFTKLSNREKSIKNEIMYFIKDVLLNSSTVYAGLLLNKSKREILADINTYYKSYIRKYPEADNSIAKSKYRSKILFYRDISNLLKVTDIEPLRTELSFWYESFSYEYKIPYFKNAPIKFDSSTCKLETSDIEAPFVITLSNPFEKNCRYQIPLYTSEKVIARYNKYKCSTSFNVRIKPDGHVHVMAAIEKETKINTPEEYIGVDTGMTDIFYLSNGEHFGTFTKLIDFYKDEVEPANSKLSDLRNKRRKIKHFYQKHKNVLPQEVKSELIKKMNNLDKMISQNKIAKRKTNHYYKLLNEIIKNVIHQYVNSINKNIVTVLELLDIKEFEASKEINGRRSIFARGLLQKRLMEFLTWNGYKYIEVDPTYTSQVCPKCYNLDKDNRNYKEFKCTSCGYTDDADHVGSINIRERALDKKLISIIKPLPTHEQRSKALCEYYAEKHKTSAVQAA